jgi:small nuclear ribonucleoprotein (snRNP)-like protein
MNTFTETDLLLFLSGETNQTQNKEIQLELSRNFELKSTLEKLESNLNLFSSLAKEPPQRVIDQILKQVTENNLVTS